MNGLQNINIELTSRCNKNCWMCGRRKQENDWPELCDWGDMPIDLVKKISVQVPKGVFIQFHNNGEPLLYPDLGKAIRYFEGNYMGLDTNAKLLMKKHDEIKSLTSVTISIIPDDPEGDEQLGIAEEYLTLKKRPSVVFRMLGEIDLARKYLIKKYCEKFDRVDKCERILHRPEGSFGYEKTVTKPEIGICLEMLHKLAIDRYGNVYPCVRFDPKKKNILGNVNALPLADIWNSLMRKLWVQYHINFRRERVPLCGECSFYGVPRG